MALGGVELEYDCWRTQDDPEVLMLDFAVDPLLDEGIRREIQKTGTLMHAQLHVAGLDLDASAVEGLAALRDFARLRVLSLRDNAVSDLSPLSNLYYLEQLDLSGNQINDLSSLYGLTQFKEVRLEGNPELTQTDIDQLRKALPTTKISGRTARMPLPMHLA